MRPLLVRHAYELCGGESLKRVLPFCAAAEILNISTYQANICFDGKGQELSSEDRKAQYASAFLTLGLALELAHTLTEFSEIEPGMISSMIMNTIQALYEGQIVDCSVLKIRKSEELGYANYLMLYENRCKLLGGELTSLCMSLGALAAGWNANEAHKLKMIGIPLGIGGQMVNDLGDILSIGDEDSFRYAMPFSDLLSGKLTLPLFYILKTSDPEQIARIYDYSSKSCIATMEMEDIIKLFVESKAIRPIKKLIRKHHKEAKDALNLLFPPTVYRSRMKLFLTSLLSNKYFYKYRKIEEQMKN